MKKSLSILIALLLIFSIVSMVGCADDKADAPADTTPAETAPAETAPAETDTPAEPAASKPNENIQQKLDAGEEVIFGFASLADNFFTNQILGEGIRAYVESIGMSYSFQSADENVSTLITLIENYAEMGAAICMTLPPDGGTVQSAIEAAQAKGTTCIVWGTSADYDTVVATYNDPVYGKAIGDMAVAWIDQHFDNPADGSVKTAFQYQSAIVDVITRTEAVFDVLNACPAIDVVYEVDDPTNTLDCGYTHAEEAFTVAPDLNVFIWLDNSSCFGGNNYVMSRPDLNKEDIGFFTSGYDDIMIDLLEQSKTNESVFRGVIQDGESSADSAITAIKAIVSGDIEIPYFAYQPMFSKVSGFDFEFDSRVA